MKAGALATIFRRSARDEKAHEGTRARYLAEGMTHDMADLLTTMAKISDMPREERHTTPAGRALWIKYMAGCAMVETDFEAFARNRAFNTFRSELKRLAAMVDQSGEREAGR